MKTVGLARGAHKWLGLWSGVPVLLGVVLAWDASGLDLALARWMAQGHAFAWRDDWVGAVLLHGGMRQVAFAVAAWLVVGVWFPTGVLRRVSRAGRLQWLASILLSVTLVNLLKHSSLTSCPWDLAEFGGTANYLTHWAWGRGDGGPGHCFPAGHASAGFSFLGGYFAFKPVASRAAWACLATALVAGFALGVSQQLRGAHFMSHTLWTAWLCWTSAWLADVAMQVGWTGQEGVGASRAA